MYAIYIYYYYLLLLLSTINYFIILYLVSWSTPCSNHIQNPPWMHRTSVSWGKEEILQLRAMELKHGRVAMLAVLGWFHVAAGYHIVGDYAVGEHLDNNPLVNLTQMPMGGIWQVVFTIMCLEWVTTYVSRSEIWRDMWGRCSFQLAFRTTKWISMDFPSVSIRESVGFPAGLQAPSWEALGHPGLERHPHWGGGDWLGGWCIATIEPTQQLKFGIWVNYPLRYIVNWTHPGTSLPHGPGWEEHLEPVQEGREPGAEQRQVGHDGHHRWAWWGRATAATGRYRMLHVFGSFEPPIFNGE